MSMIVNNKTIPKGGECESYGQNYSNKWKKRMTEPKTNLIHNLVVSRSQRRLEPLCSDPQLRTHLPQALPRER